MIISIRMIHDSSQVVQNAVSLLALPLNVSIICSRRRGLGSVGGSGSRSVCVCDTIDK